MRVYEYTFTRKRVAEIGPSMRAPRDIYEMIRPRVEGLESENLFVILLNAKNKAIGLERVYAGNVSSALVRVGELFRAAVRLNASGVIVVHNHPSGDPEPSLDDLHLTAEATAAGRLLDIPLLDHLVVSDTGYVSLRDRGAIS